MPPCPHVVLAKEREGKEPWNLCLCLFSVLSDTQEWVSSLVPTKRENRSSLICVMFPPTPTLINMQATEVLGLMLLYLEEERVQTVWGRILSEFSEKQIVLTHQTCHP